MKFLRNLILSFVFAGAMSMTTSANAACKVHLGDFDWDSANIHTAIAGYIIEKGYGCEVEVNKRKYYSNNGSSFRSTNRYHY